MMCCYRVETIVNTIFFAFRCNQIEGIRGNDRKANKEAAKKVVMAHEAPEARGGRYFTQQSLVEEKEKELPPVDVTANYTAADNYPDGSTFRG